MDQTQIHPTTVSISQEQLRQDFVKAAYTQLPDAKWHFETVLHKSTRMAKPAEKVPVAGSDVVSLALFNRPEPVCDVEIFGVHIVYDVNPADWLDLWLEKNGHANVLSRKRFPYIGGAIGDVVARWDVAGIPWIGRFFVTKVGPRMMLLWARCAEVDYEKLAEPIFLSIMSFRFLDTSAGPLAEGVRWVNGQAPVTWKLALPASWEATIEPGNEQAASFQANFMSPQAGDAPAQILGKLSFAIIAPDLVKDAQDFGEKTLTALRDSGVSHDSSEYVQEATSAPYTGAWTLESKGTLNGTPVAVLGRVLRHPKAWVSSMVVSPGRDVSPALWMQVRRLLDIVTMTLVIG